MKLVSINIEIDRHHDTVNALIEKEKPDVICFQELLEEDFEYFKAVYKMNGLYIPTVYMQSPSHGGPQNRRYGIGIFANNIVAHGFNYYEGSKEHIDLPFNEYFNGQTRVPDDRAILWADILIEGVVYKIVTTHFTITDAGVSTPFQLESLERLFNVLDLLSEFVLVGDMNAPRGLETWSRLASKYKDNIPKEYTTSLDLAFHRVKVLQFMVDGLFTTPLYHASNVRLVYDISDHMAIIGEVTKSDI